MTNALHAYERSTEVNDPILKYLNENKLHAMKRKGDENKMLKVKLCMVSLVSNALLNGDLLSALFSAAYY